MQSVDVTIQNQQGLHTRPASIFVREAAKFNSEITISSKDRTVNGKSIMGLLMLALTPGSLVTLSASGPDEEDALQTLEKILSGRFS